MVDSDVPITTVSPQILYAHPKKGDFTKMETKFASHFVAQYVYCKLEQEGRDEVISFMSAAVGRPILHGVYGLVFKSFCHRELPSGIHLKLNH